MLKIGLLTVDTYEYNYGTSLQQYATLKIFEKCLKGIDKKVCLEIISYIPNCSNRIKKYNLINLKNIIKDARKQLNLYGNIILNDFSTNYFNARKFHEFDRKYLNISNFELDEYSDLSILNYKYDYLLLGSDQTLNPYAYSFNDKFFLMEYFINKKNILTYAPSMGVAEYPQERLEEYFKCFKSIKNLSGREQKQCDYVNSLLQEDKMTLVLDPTLLLPKEEYIPLEKSLKHPNKYLLIVSYGGLSKDKIDFVNKYAEMNKLEIIQIGNFVNKDWKFFRSGPSEFLYLIHNSDLVFTDAYHAVCLSLVYKKQFIYFERENIRTREDGTKWFSRFENLENLFHISGAKYEKIKNFDEYIFIDYELVNKKLESMIKKSFDFIYKEINEIDLCNCEQKTLESLEIINNKINLLGEKIYDKKWILAEFLEINNKLLEQTKYFNDKLNILSQENKILLEKVSKPTFIQKVFSIKNENNHKILRLLGLKIKFRRKQHEFKRKITSDNYNLQSQDKIEVYVR